MKQDIVILGKLVSYMLKQSRRSRNIRISVSLMGELSVSIPLGLSFHLAEEFMKEKAEWIIKKIEENKKHDRSIFKVKRSEVSRLKVEARKFVEERLRHFNTYYRFTYKRITIRNQKSRWGSCSKNGNLNFNYRIAVLPPRVADYIIVHELCHLEELNHSENFWGLVSESISDYKILRAELKKMHVV